MKQKFTLFIIANSSLSTSRSRRGESLCSNSNVRPCWSCETKMLSPLPPPSLSLIDHWNVKTAVQKSHRNQVPFGENKQTMHSHSLIRQIFFAGGPASQRAAPGLWHHRVSNTKPTWMAKLTRCQNTGVSCDLHTNHSQASILVQPWLSVFTSEDRAWGSLYFLTYWKPHSLLFALVQRDGSSFNAHHCPLARCWVWRSKLNKYVNKSHPPSSNVILPSPRNK